MNAINIFLFFIGFVVYFVRPKYVPIYYVLWQTMFFFWIDLIIPIDPIAIDNALIFFMVVYIWGCCAITIVTNRKKLGKQERRILVLLIIYLIYIFALGIYRGGRTSVFLIWVMQYTSFVPLWLLIRLNNISFRFYKKYILIAICFEIVLVFMQRATGLYPSFTDGPIAENGAINIVGTLRRYNWFAENCGLLILSLIFIYFRDKKFISPLLLLLLILVGSFLVFMSGARTVLVALVVSLALIVFYQYRKVGLVISACVLSLFLIFPSLLKGEMSQLDNFDRFENLVDASKGDVDMMSKTTLFLSVLLYEEYTSTTQNMIIGPGQLFTSSYGYKGMITTDDTMADSCDMLYLCETGLIGAVFLITFLVFIIRGGGNSKMFPIAFVIYLLIVAVTDYGLFNGASAIYFLFVTDFNSKFENQDRLIDSKRKSTVVK